MKVLVQKPVNRRVGTPSVNALISGYIKEGEIIDAVDTIRGDSIKGNDLWYRDANGFHYWSGAFVPVVQPVDISKLPWWLKHNKMRIPEIWNYTKGEGVRVAVLDTGIAKHDDLEGAIDRESAFNATDGTKNVEDTDGHGTHCAGIIAGRGNKDVFGVAPACKIVPIKIFENWGNEPNIDAFLSGLNYAVSKNVDIISMSFGFSNQDGMVKEINQILFNSSFQGVMVAAVGKYKNTVAYPARFPGIVGVGAVKSDDINDISSKLSKSDSSGGGKEMGSVKVIAPGETIVSCGKNNNTGEMSGTSMATAYVSGIAALWICYQSQRNFQIGKKQEVLIKKIIQTSFPPPEDADKLYWGYGIINPFDLVLK